MIGNDLFLVEGTIEEEISEVSELESTRPSRTFRTFEGLPPDRPVPRSKGAMRGGEPVQGRAGEIPSKAEPSRFGIGLPIVYTLEDMLATNASVANYIKTQLSIYEFHWVQMACSFQPGQGHSFEKARFQVTLLTETDDPASTAMVHPALAYTLSPDRIEDEYTSTQKLSLTPELKLAAGPLEASIPMPSYERSVSNAAYRARVIAFGLQDTTCGWMFERNSSRELSGTQSLYLLVRKPKETQVRAAFHLSASVRQNGFLRFLNMKYRTRTGEIIDSPTHILC